METDKKQIKQVTRAIHLLDREFQSSLLLLQRNAFYYGISFVFCKDAKNREWFDLYISTHFQFATAFVSYFFVHQMLNEKYFVCFAPNQKKTTWIT